MKLQQFLPKINESGLESLEHPQFVQTEIDTLKKGLKGHLNITLFFFFLNSIYFVVQLRSYETNQTGYLSIFIRTIIWGLCLIFLQSWFNRKKNLAIITLIKESMSQESINIFVWFKRFKNPLKFKWWGLNSLENKTLKKLEKQTNNKLLFFGSQTLVFLLFVIGAVEGSSILTYASPVMMLGSTFAFIDWKLTHYYKELSKVKDSIE